MNKYFFVFAILVITASTEGDYSSGRRTNYKHVERKFFKGKEESLNYAELKQFQKLVENFQLYSWKCDDTRDAFRGCDYVKKALASVKDINFTANEKKSAEANINQYW